MISRIEAYNYRCFEKVDIELEDFRVIVGANGTGKTTILDIVRCFQISSLQWLSSRLSVRTLVIRGESAYGGYHYVPNTHLRTEYPPSANR